MQVRDLFDVVVVKIQEDQSWQTNQVLDFLDVVVLEVQKTKTLLTFEQRHVCEVPLVEVEPVGIGVPLRRLPVHHEHSWNLRELSEDDLVFIFNSSDDTVFQQVSISLIFFTCSEFYRNFLSEGTICTYYQH